MHGAVKRNAFTSLEFRCRSG